MYRPISHHILIHWSIYLPLYQYPISWWPSLDSSSWKLYCWSSKFVPLSKLFLSVLSLFNFHIQSTIRISISTKNDLNVYQDELLPLLIPHILPTTRTWLRLYFPEFCELCPLLWHCVSSQWKPPSTLICTSAGGTTVVSLQNSF